MKKYGYLFLLSVLYMIPAMIQAQTDLSEASIKIINFSEEAFSEGTNEFAGGTQSKVKLSFKKVGDSNTFSISQADVFTCDGNTGAGIANLAFTNTNSNDYAYIQIENTGTSTITHIAFRGWYNAGASNNMLTYGYSTTTEEETEFIVPMIMEIIEDTPLFFQAACSVGETFDQTAIPEVSGVKYIRLSSSPTFPNLPFNVFSNANTNVAIYGIYIWTDDQGIPSGVNVSTEEKLSMKYDRHIISFSRKVDAEVRDVSGRVMAQYKGITQMPVSCSEKGVYLIRAITPDGECLTEKIYY
ncbi:MAG: hypothetical protein LUG18_03245 [Candidatus Azobacteroides sp.]|nr:hypothetical protein [Candidatus Azobacteroides sp.]